MYLVDTNIFLEILLKQAKSEDCKRFLTENVGQLHITDFSLHSIGVILFKQDKEDLFVKFISDSLSKLQLISLPQHQYKDLARHKSNLKLDFDDAYQYTVSKHFGITIVTMDTDFKKAEDVNVRFL